MTISWGLFILNIGMAFGADNFIVSSIWPMPVEMSLGQSTIYVSQNVKFITNNDLDVKTLNDAYERYKSIMFTHAYAGGKDTPLASEVMITVKDTSEAYPQLETDESYTLDISDKAEIFITAQTVYGALRALESLSQLVMYDYDEGAYIIVNCPISVTDAPRYQHRGLLLDTSRHYQPLRALRRTIDALSYAKYNGTLFQLIHPLIVIVRHFHLINSFALARRGHTELPLPVHLLPQAMERCIHICREVSPGRHRRSGGVRPQSRCQGDD
jgi:hypothetical protein